MCEIFAMSSRHPTAVTLSMGALARHGRPGGHLDDGWGVAFHDGADASLLREPGAAGDSPLLRLLADRPPRAALVLAHIRHATQGTRGLRNTQPFARELGGRMHVFAHNGNLLGQPPARGRFRPVGETDSETAFCRLLDRLAPLWAGGVPPLADRLGALAGLAAELRALGPANFVYTDGDALFAHGDRRIQPDGRVAPPGLMLLERACDMDPEVLSPASSDLAGIDLAQGISGQHVALVASVALSAEPWRALRQGEMVAIRGGVVEHAG
ncbi:MAG: hypothetical protein BGP12_05570 [Rhodospirillales bacterium 70-18]|nr:MAG: hypothetical protein BGP12_05570 [Rhodospirillales bacterium 70-18]